MTSALVEFHKYGRRRASRAAAAKVRRTRGNSMAARAGALLMPEGNEGVYAISLMRLVGDTFEFHECAAARWRLHEASDTDITVPARAN